MGKKKTPPVVEKDVAYLGGTKLLTPPPPTGDDVTVRFKKLHPDAKAPFRATPGSAGWDITAVRAVRFAPHQTRKVPTGIAIELPPGFVADFRPRSSLASKGLLTVIGTVDSDFRGELFGSITNTSTVPLSIAAGDRIGQLVIHRLPVITFEEVDELDETERGPGGWGSTGA